MIENFDRALARLPYYIGAEYYADLVKILGRHETLSENRPVVEDIMDLWGKYNLSFMGRVDRVNRIMKFIKENKEVKTPNCCDAFVSNGRCSKCKENN